MEREVWRGGASVLHFHIVAMPHITLYADVTSTYHYRPSVRPVSSADRHVVSEYV